MMPRYLIDNAIDRFINFDKTIINHGLHEQTIVGRISYHLQFLASNSYEYRGYYADVEYNRASGGIIKRWIREGGDQNHINRVFVDLVLHGRGELIGNRENVICCEIKKFESSTAWESVEHAERSVFTNGGIVNDQNKLISFTQNGDENNDDGFVCNYMLGVLIVPRFDNQNNYNGLPFNIPQIFVRYYREGRRIVADDRIINIEFRA